MFAPEGYDLFPELLTLIEKSIDFDSDYFDDLLTEIYQDDFEPFFDNPDFVFMSHSYLEWVLFKDDEINKNIFLANRKGRIMHVLPEIFVDNSALFMSSPVTRLFEFLQKGKFQDAKTYARLFSTLQFRAFSEQGLITGYDLAICENEMREFSKSDFLQNRLENFDPQMPELEPIKNIDVILGELRELNRLIKPFKGWSICFKRGAFEDLLQNPDKYIFDIDRRNHSHNVTQEIVRKQRQEAEALSKLLKYLADNPGAQIPKEKAKQTFGPNLSIRGFNDRVWTKAVDVYPYLSKPGRKS